MPQTLDFTGFLGFFPSAIYKIINSFSSCQSTDFFDLVTLERSPIWGMLCCHHQHFSEQIRTESCFSFFPFGECLGFLLGGGRSILLSYRDIYEISLILRGFLRFVQGDDLYFRGKIHQKNGHFANGFLPLESNLLKNVPLPRRQKSAEFTTPLEPDFRFQKIIWPVINIFLGVDPIQHREVTPDAKKCLEIQAFSAFAFPSDTTL